MPKLTDVDKCIIYLQVEKSKLNREKAGIVLNKSLMLYFSFMAVAIIGFVSGYFGTRILTMLVAVSIIILLIGAVPYLVISHQEGKKIDAMISQLLKK